MSGRGLELTNDIKVYNGMRWMTVRPPGNANWFGFTQRTA